MSKKTLLVEVGTEELPANILRKLAESFYTNLISELNYYRIKYSKIKWFATPRRLALQVFHLSDFQEDYTIEKKGPSIDLAFDNQGNLTQIAKKWAYNYGIPLDQVKKLINKKSNRLLYLSHIRGINTEILLPDIMISSIKKLRTSQLMRWGSGDTQFVRPIRTITLLLDNMVIQTKMFGVKSNRVIFGHRFIGESMLTINHANQYSSILLNYGKVIADYEARKTKIQINAEKAARSVNGNIELDDILFEEVTSLVEWPVVLIANFQKIFLSIPDEILALVIKKKQKCFPIYTSNKKILPYVIFVANIESNNSKKLIHNNEKVLHSRLKDVKFFFDSDRKKRLEDYLPCLNNVIFQKELGSLRDKTNRIQSLSIWIAKNIGADVNDVSRASLLSKCDLMTHMVFEFPETQGITGMYYAYEDGEDKDIAIAIREQYLPRFSKDSLPSNLISCTLAISDKIDTLSGIFGIGKKPQKDKDPFALRRAALGICRIFIDKNIDLDLKDLTKKAVNIYGSILTNNNVVNEVVDFILNRLYAWYQEKKYNIHIIQAVLSGTSTCLTDIDSRIKALSYSFDTDQDAIEKLVIINKRISNILGKKNNIFTDDTIITYNDSLTKEKSEIQLAKKFKILKNKLIPYFEKRLYKDALFELTTLYDPIEEFFQDVKIHIEDKSMRVNRLALLREIQTLFLNIGDIAQLQSLFRNK